MRRIYLMLKTTAIFLALVGPFKVLALGAESTEFLTLDKSGKIIHLEYRSTAADEAKDKRLYGNPNIPALAFCEHRLIEVTCSPSRDGSPGWQYKLAPPNSPVLSEAQAIFAKHARYQRKIHGSVGTLFGVYVCESGCASDRSPVLVYVAYGDEEE